MSAIIQGTDKTAVTFGIAQDEVGLKIESVKFDAQGKKIEVAHKNSGDIDLVVTHGKTVNVEMSGETLALPAQSIGEPLAVANLVALGGVESGMVITEGVSLELSREGLRKATIKGTRYPGIAAA